MDAFFEYLRNISYYLIFMTAVGIIAPSGTYKKYISLIMGILLIATVVSPLSTLLTQDPTAILQTNFALPQQILQPLQIEQPDYFEEFFHSQLTAQADALLSRNGYHLVSATWETAEDFTYIRRASIVARAINAEPTPVPFIRIEPVRIAPYQPFDPEAAEAKEVLALKILLSDFYDMSADNIHVEILKE